MKKALLVYNPMAGNGMIRNHLDFIISRFQDAGYTVIPVRGARSEHLDPIMQEAKQVGVERIIAAGGDGTIDLVVNSMVRNDVDVPLAIFPVGTANDFAYYFKMPNEIEAMVEIALGDEMQNVDIGDINGRNFINVAAMGCLVDLSQRTDPGMKNTLGVLAYYLQGMVELPNLHPIPMRFESEEFTGEENVYFALVMNGKSAGSFKQLATPAEVDDGKLDVLLFKETPAKDFLPLVFSILAGQHRENENVKYFQTAHIKIDADEEIGVDVDGETAGPFPLDIKVVPRRLRVMVPKEKPCPEKLDRYKVIEERLFGTK